MAELAALHDAWAERCGVVPWAELLAMRAERGKRDETQAAGGKKPPVVN